MIKKFFIFISILMLSGCSFDSILALSKINKVQKVRTTRYTQEYRAYFARDDLQYITRRDKFLFYYNKRNQDLAILLHPQGEYIAYSITHTPKKILQVDASPKKRYRYVNYLLKKSGYKRVNPNSVGYQASISRRILKGHKTFYLRAINYQKLLYKYKNAIRTYNASKVANIHHKPPRYLINSYFNRYLKKAKTTKQKQQIKQIGYKLGILKRKLSKDTNVQTHTQKTNNNKTNIKTTQKVATSKTTNNITTTTSNKLFNKYIGCNSYQKLHKFLQTKEAQETLNFTQFSRLSYRESQLQEEELLQNGSIEELIEQYKKTNNPRYKKRAMELMKQHKSQDRG